MQFITPQHTVASAGNVTINGQVTYQPRNWDPQHPNLRTGNELKIELYEKDLLGNRYLLDTTYTDKDGNFSFPSRPNWWTPDNRQLNVLFQVVTVNQNTAVTTTTGANYGFLSRAKFLSSDTTTTWTINFPITDTYQSYPAIWIFEDLRNAWNYVHDNDYRNGVPYNPGNVTAEWEKNLDCFLSVCNSFTWAPGFPPYFIFISDFDNKNSMDIVVHETGHMFMYNANKWWNSDSSCWHHYMFQSINTNCAWSEGWADFLPLPVNGDHCFNIMAVNPCAGGVDWNYYDLEKHNRADDPNGINKWGDAVEGRVAATLYDLYDSNNEGYDRQSAGFSAISHIALGTTQVKTLYTFWNKWINGHDQFLTGLTFWWNTINYENIRQAFLPVARK